MAKNITIKVPGKHPQTGELTTFELNGQRMDIDIGWPSSALPHSREGHRHLAHPHPERLSHHAARRLAHGSLRSP